jgi:NADH:ubiquinone oxidoreductase subunit 6 (subunit J)
MLKSPAPLIVPSESPANPLGASDKGELLDLLREWEIPAGREQAVHDLALASLSQVKGSTEYDDARALLTIVAFLTALAGAVFNRFSSTYELPRWQQISDHCENLWPALTYALFGAYAVLVAVSAFVIFGAMKPTMFGQSRDWRQRAPRDSFTFHAQLLETHPRMWGQSFIELTGDHRSSGDKLTAQYAKQYILETYVVAEKIALKLRKAAPAVRWLQLSMLFLAGFIVSYGATLVFLAPSTLR